VASMAIYQRVLAAVARATHRPVIEIKPDWYY
jgi:hypothetical protein